MPHYRVPQSWQPKWSLTLALITIYVSFMSTNVVIGFTNLITGHIIYFMSTTTTTIIDFISLITVCIIPVNKTSRWSYHPDHSVRWVTSLLWSLRTFILMNMVSHCSGHSYVISCHWLQLTLWSLCMTRVANFSTLWSVCTHLSLISELLPRILYIFKQTCLGPHV